MYHINFKGEVGKCNAKKSCPFGDLTTDHYSTIREAAAAYEAKNSTKSFKSFRKSQESYRRALLNNIDKYPQEILLQLSDYLDAQPTTPLVIMPHGSDLYNTGIPGRAVHDYDFVVFTTPTGNKKTKIKQTLHGELDITSIEITKMDLYAEKSAPITESFMGYKAGYGLYSNNVNEWSPFLNNYNISLNKYYHLLGRVFKSHRFDEPATIDGDKVNFKNFKNCVRWGLYMKRWGDGGDYKIFDPRLTDGERKLFLNALDSGYFKDIYE